MKINKIAKKKYLEFSKYEGSQHIAKEHSIFRILELIKNNQIQDKKCHDIKNDSSGNGSGIVPDGNYSVGMKASFELKKSILDHDDMSYNFHPTRSRSRRGSQKHHDKEHHRKKGRPNCEIR